MKKKELMLVIGVAIGVVLCFYLIIYRPSSNEIEKLKSGMHQFQGIGLREKVMKQSHVKKKEEVEELTTRVDRLAVRLLGAEEEDSFMKELRRIVANADVYGDSVKRNGVIRKGEQTYLALGVRLKGSFEKVYAFLRAVEDMDKNVWFDEIKLTRAEGGNGIVSLDLSLSVPQLEELE